MTPFCGLSGRGYSTCCTITSFLFLNRPRDVCLTADISVVLTAVDPKCGPLLEYAAFKFHATHLLHTTFFSHIILLFIMLLIILFICLTCFQLNLIQVNKINPEHNYSKTCEQHTHNTTYRLLTDEEKMNEEEE